MEQTVKLPSVMHNRNYALLFWGDFVSKIGNLFFSLAISFYILEITGNNAVIQGAYLALAGVVSLIFTPLGGVLADRRSKVRIIYTTDFIRGACILLAACLIRRFPAVNAQLAVLFTVNVVLNVCGALFGPATGSIIKFIVRDEQLQQATSYFSTAQSIESIAGTLAAGLFYAAFGVFWVFILDGISFLLSGLSELFIRCEREQVSEKLTLRGTLLDMRDGLSYIRMNKPLTVMMLIALGLNMFFSPLFANGVSYLCNVYLADGGGLNVAFMNKEVWFASFDIAISVGMLVVSLILGAKKPKERCGPDIRRWIGILGAMMLLNLLSYYYFVGLRGAAGIYALTFLAGCLFAGAAMGNINIPVNVAFMRMTDNAMLGKVSGITGTISMALIPIGNMIGGLLIAWRGLSALYLFCTAGFIGMTVFALTNRRLGKL